MRGAFLYIATFLAGFTRACSASSHDCDESADILFVQDLQDTMERDLKEIEDDIDEIMDEFQDVFRHPRFGIVTFKEVNGLGCVDIAQSLTKDEDDVEDVYERLKARAPASVRNYGSPLAGLLAGLAWEDIEWKSANRIIMVFTNNMPTPFKEPEAWPLWHSSECHRVVQPPEELVLDYAKLAGTTILFVVPHASNIVVSYWERFNAMLGQNSRLVTLSSHDLDDWIEGKKEFFKLLKARNCFGGTNHFSTPHVSSTRGIIPMTPLTTPDQGSIFSDAPSLPSSVSAMVPPEAYPSWHAPSESVQTAARTSQGIYKSDGSLAADLVSRSSTHYMQKPMTMQEIDAYPGMSGI